MCLDLFCICLQQYFIKTRVWSLMYMCLACNFFNDIHIYFSFSSRPTDPKFLTGQPEKQQINLEWPK